jgi:hypothetical protein
VTKKINSVKVIREVARKLISENVGECPARFKMASGKYLVRSDAWDAFKAAVTEEYDVLLTPDKKNCFLVRRSF